MNASDPLSTLFARLMITIRAQRNFFRIRKNKRCIPLLRVLCREGYLSGYATDRTNMFLYVYIKYLNHRPMLYSIRRLSTPSRRLFVRNHDLSHRNPEYTIYLLSTSLGILTTRQAITYNVGGELLCKIA